MTPWQAPPDAAGRFAPAVDQATVGYDTPLRRVIRYAGAAGIGTLEVPVHCVLAAERESGRTGLADLLRESGTGIGQLSCGTGIPADLTIGQAAWPAAIDAWRRACALAARLGGVPLSLFVPRPSSPRQRITAPELTSRLAELTAVCAPLGLAVNVEIHDPVHGRDGGDLWERWQVLPGARAGLLIDTATLAVAPGDSAAYLDALPSGAIGWIQLADLVGFTAAGTCPVRALPGKGVIDLAAMLNACAGNGYRGPVSVEVPCSATVPPGVVREHVRAAADALHAPPLAALFTWDMPR